MVVAVLVPVDSGGRGTSGGKVVTVVAVSVRCSRCRGRRSGGSTSIPTVINSTLVIVPAAVV